MRSSPKYGKPYKGTKGFTLVEAMIVMAIVGLLAAIAIPNFIRARNEANSCTCIANLRQIANGKQLWSAASGAGASGTPSWEDMVPAYVQSRTDCPSGGTYTVGDMSTLPVCSTAGHSL